MKNKSSFSIAIFLIVAATVFAQKPGSLIIKVKDNKTATKKVDATGGQFIKIENNSNEVLNIRIGGTEFKIPIEGYQTLYNWNKDKENFKTDDSENPISFRNFEQLRIELTNSQKESIKIEDSDVEKPKPSLSKNSLPIAFIPTEEEEKMIEANLSYETSKAIKSSVNKPFEIIYNYQDETFYYFKNGKEVSQSKKTQQFRPDVGKDLYIRFVGYHPYLDTPSVSIDFKDRNTEYNEQFLSIVEQGIKRDTIKPKPEVPSETAAQNLTDTKKIDTLFTQFRQEMILFYNLKKQNRSLSMAFLEKCIDHIKIQILKNFEIDNTNPDAILAKGKELTAKISDETEKRKLLNILEEGVSFYQRIISYNYLSFKPIQIPSSDVTELTIRWKGSSSINTPSPFTYFNRGGLKFDVSAGVFVNGLVDHKFNLVAQSVRDTTFNVQNPQKIDTIKLVTKGRIVQETNSKFDVGFGLLGHFYPRGLICNRFNIALSTGILTETKNEELRLKYLAGGSFILGSEQRIVLSGGVILGKVARLAEELQAGTNGTLMNYTTGQANTVPTRDIYTTNWFFSCTYNFGGIRNSAVSK